MNEIKGKRGGHKRARKYPGIKGAARPDKAFERRQKRNGGAL